MSKYDEFGEDEFLDGAAKSLGNYKNCFRCIHLHKDNQHCDAFPLGSGGGIPIVYITGEKEHTKPSKKYNQKNNIVWEYDKEQVWIKRQWKIDNNTETKVVKCGTDQDKAIRIMKKLEKEGWNVRSDTYDTWPQEWTLYADRKKKKK